MFELETLDSKSWKEFLSSPKAVLIISKIGCISCDVWTQELSDWLGSENPSTDVRFGKILLDAPRLTEFKIENRWIQNISILPHNSIFIDGKQVCQWPGKGIEKLQNYLDSSNISL
jgi:hypothetical protein